MQTTMKDKTKPKKLRIERFLNEMDQIVPWQQLEKVIQPHDKCTDGRPPHELRVLLRIHFLQLWHNLSDPLDEISIKKGAIYRIVVSDLVRRPIWFGGVDSSEQNMDLFYQWLEKRKVAGIRLAGMDVAGLREFNHEACASGGDPVRQVSCDETPGQGARYGAETGIQAADREGPVLY